MDAIIITRASVEEIAALALAVQGRHESNVKLTVDGNSIAEVALEAMRDTHEDMQN